MGQRAFSAAPARVSSHLAATRCWGRQRRCARCHSMRAPFGMRNSCAARALFRARVRLLPCHRRAQGRVAARSRRTFARAMCRRGAVAFRRAPGMLPAGVRFQPSCCGALLGAATSLRSLPRVRSPVRGVPMRRVLGWLVGWVWGVSSVCTPIIPSFAGGHTRQGARHGLELAWLRHMEGLGAVGASWFSGICNPLQLSSRLPLSCKSQKKWSEFGSRELSLPRGGMKGVMTGAADGAWGGSAPCARARAHGLTRTAFGCRLRPRYTACVTGRWACCLACAWAAAGWQENR